VYGPGRARDNRNNVHRAPPNGDARRPVASGPNSAPRTGSFRTPGPVPATRRKGTRRTGDRTPEGTGRDSLTFHP
jgi:hypothetical protein